MNELTPTVGFGTTVKTMVALELQTPLEPCKVAMPTANEDEKGGIANKEVLGATGELLVMILGVYKV